MNRFFYTDPIAAAWMAFNQGLRFENCGFAQMEKARDFVVKIHCLLRDDESLRFYIHPECLPLLEPQKGDLIEYMGLLGGFSIGTVTDAPYEGEDGEMVFCIDEADSFPVENLHRVILRNGKPFHWPESGAA